MNILNRILRGIWYKFFRCDRNQIHQSHCALVSLVYAPHWVDFQKFCLLRQTKQIPVVYFHSILPLEFDFLKIYPTECDTTPKYFWWPVLVGVDTSNCMLNLSRKESSFSTCIDFKVIGVLKFTIMYLCKFNQFWDSL